MANRNVDGEIIVGINQPESLKVMDEDLKRILTQITDLEAKISHAKLDRTAVEELQKQIGDLKASINVSDIRIDQGQAAKSAQQSGKQIGGAISKGVSSNLKKIKNDIADTVKSFDRLNAQKLIEDMNLNRPSVGSDTINQVRSLVSEINILGREVAKTGSDSSWDELISKSSELGKILDKFGKTRAAIPDDLNKLKEYFDNKKIFVGYNSSGLSGTDFGVKQLDKEFKDLHVKFTATKQDAIDLNSVWEEMCEHIGRPDLLSVDTWQDQISTVIQELQKAKSLLVDEEGLIDYPNAHGAVSEYLDDVEKARNRVAMFENEMSSLMQKESQDSTSTANAVIQNEERKQQAVNESSEVLKSAQAGSSKEQDAYEAAYKELKKLYDLRIEYAKIGSNKKTDFYFENAISKQEEAYRQARANTSTPENWDVQKRLELERQELVMQDRLEKAYGRAAEAKKDAAKAGDIGNSVDRGDYDAKFEKLKASYDKLGFTSAEVEARTNDVALALDRLKEKNLDTLVQDEKDFANALKKSQNEADILKTDLSSIYNPKKQTKLSNDIQNWLSRNKRASEEARNSLQEYYNELSNGRVSVEELNQIEQAYKRIDTEQRGLGRIGKSLKEQFSEAGAALAQMVSISAGVMGAISKTKEAVSELKDLDDILTEISKTSDLTKQQLEDLGNNAFEAASKYGRTATDYLTGVQEMYRAGFDNAEQMAELSILAQAAGDMESDSANDYLMATNAAYDFKGSVEELNKVLDSQNYITNNAAVSMQDMADATSEAASIAAQYGVGIDELSAMIAVVTSKTRESGSEVGTALKSIFVTLQDTTSKPVVEAFDAVGISMTKIVDGAERLKTPIELLKELSVAFNELPEGAIERANILTDIGKKYHANTLSAILSDWESYESMIDLYSQGMGSAAEEAEKSANNITGSLNRLHNTWVDTVENVANSDAIITIINGLNSLLSVVNNVTDKLGSAGTIGVGAGLFAGLKNIGKRRMSIRIS